MNDIQTAVENELTRANEIYGERFNSPHEAYAVILEEFEEAVEGMSTIENDIDDFWIMVKNVRTPETMRNTIGHLKRTAENTAMELVQVAAMCKKALASMKE